MLFTFTKCKNTMLFLLSLAYVHIYSMEEQRLQNISPLHTQRPLEIQDRIDKVFKVLSTNTKCTWLENGDHSDEYGIANISERELLLALIKNAPKEQKAFYLLDVGAGNFGWSNGMEDCVKKMFYDGTISSDKKIHIVNVRGEQYNEPPINDYDTCTVYKFGSFKIENIEKELIKRNLDVHFDLIVSRWTLRHLVDPTGTLEQLYHRLNNHGLCLFDGFFVHLNNHKDPDASEHVTEILLNSKMPFLVMYHSVGRSGNHFLLRKEKNNEQLTVPLTYSDITNIDVSEYQCYAATITQFLYEPNQWEKLIRIDDQDTEDIYKNLAPFHFIYKAWYGKKIEAVYNGPAYAKPLFDWLIEHNIIEKQKI